MKAKRQFLNCLVVVIAVTIILMGCSSSGLGTSLGVKEDFQYQDGEGVYRVTASSFSGKYRIGPPPEEISNLQPVEFEVEVTVEREPGILHLEFDAPEGETPLVLDLEGGETIRGSGIGLISDERVLMDLNAFKKGAGQVTITINFKQLEK